VTEEEMQKLRDAVIETVDSRLEQYDWDAALKRYLEAQ
jgi:hypothetical protein